MPTHSTLSRRRFLKITAAMGLGLGVAGRLLANGENSGLHRVQETRLLMGSIANLTLLGEQADKCHRAIQAAFERMAALEQVFSLYRASSTLCQLNRGGRVSNTCPEFRYVMAQATSYGELTSGAFDVTVEPLLALYRSVPTTGQLPTSKQVDTAQRLVDYRQIDIDRDTVQLRKGGMSVTLDGIAKGYIIDEGKRVLVEHGFEEVLVEVGGDMQAHGQHVWQIGIQSPTAPERDFVRVKPLTNCALTTSGDYINTFTSDQRLHHIIDPRLGTSPTELTSVSITAPNACQADALSTACMVLGLARGLQLVKTLSGVEAMLITKDQQIVTSPQF